MLHSVVFLALIATACSGERTQPPAAKPPPSAPEPALTDADFDPLPKPKPGDWLAEHREPGQTFDQFVRSRPNTPDLERNTIYLLPVGRFDAAVSPPMKLLAEAASLYWSLDAQVLPPVSVAKLGATTRKNPHTGKLQLLAGDVLTYLKRRVPEDAYSIIALTEVDLYPDPEWNFVFGLGSFNERVGVYSFARYHPSFYDNEMPVAKAREVILRRALKVMVHELGHMFGIHHCTHYSCVMNGSNHMDESDSQPLHLCPIDLRKAAYSLKFHYAERYRDLAAFYERIGLDEEAAWAHRRAQKTRAEKTTP